MKPRALNQWIERLLAESPIRANSLIITIYGDMIAPHGGTVWLGSFIKLVEPLGLNARMVRTSVFRLVKEKWLIAEQIGRRSYYSLTPSGRRRFEHAYRRIYANATPDWDGQWHLVLLPGDLAASARDSLRKDLLWEGFATIAPGVMAHPGATTDSVLDILQEAGMHDKVVFLQAKTLGALSSRPLRELVSAGWNLDRVGAEYQRFLDRFASIARTPRGDDILDPQQCFMIRTLLIHEFRRVQLRDPQLPRPLLPKDWPGDAARTLCRDLYTNCLAGSEAHLKAVLTTADGAIPELAAEFFDRFGGLDPL